MTAPAPLAALRRSVLGAWLAVAYGLAVLASALAPSPVLAHGGLDQAVLCSGLSVPGSDQPEAGNEPSHCKGCFGTPVAAPPPPAGFVLAAPLGRLRETLRPSSSPVAKTPRFGLPQSRAPPAFG